MIVSPVGNKNDSPIPEPLPTTPTEERIKKKYEEVPGEKEKQKKENI